MVLVGRDVFDQLPNIAGTKVENLCRGDLLIIAVFDNCALKNKTR
jgi:hypothetical protein